MSFKIQSTNIGRKVTATDNGIIFSLPSMKSELLAPCMGNDYEYKELTIVSEPYFLHTKWYLDTHNTIYKVFNVLYNGNVYTVKANAIQDVNPKCSCCGQLLPNKWTAFVKDMYTGNNKVNTVIALKKATGWGLKESKEFFDKVVG